MYDITNYAYECVYIYRYVYLLSWSINIIVSANYLIARTAASSRHRDKAPFATVAIDAKQR